VAFPTKTWPFVATVLAALGFWLTTTGNSVSQHDAYIFTGLAAGAYALSRGLAKWNSDGKPFYKSSEFWIIILGAVVTTFGFFKGHMSALTWTEISGFLTFATAVAEGLRTPPPDGIRG
jgi:uncharacterized membrane protein